MRLTFQQAIEFEVTDARTIDVECIPLQMVPITARQLIGKTYRGAWSIGSHVAGRDATVRVIMSIYAGCLSPTAQAVDRLYRLHANALLGTQYNTTVDADGLETVSPSIPEGQPLSPVASGLSLTETAIRTRYVVENGLLGITSAGLPDGRSYRDILQEIADKAVGGELDDEMLAELSKIALLLV